VSGGGESPASCTRARPRILHIPASGTSPHLAHAHAHASCTSRILHTRTPPHLAHAHAPHLAHAHTQCGSGQPGFRQIRHVRLLRMPASCASPHLAHPQQRADVLLSRWAQRGTQGHQGSPGFTRVHQGSPGLCCRFTRVHQGSAAGSPGFTRVHQGSAAGSPGFTSPAPQRQMCCCRCCRRGATTGRKATSLTRFGSVLRAYVCVCVVRG